MRLFRTVASLAFLALGLSACAASVPRDMAFGPEAANGLLVVVVPRAAFPHDAQLRRVDLARGRFEGESLTFGVRGGVGAALDPDGPVTLVAAEVPPGDYAVVGLFTSRGAAQAGGCLDGGAPVYSVGPGRIVVVRTDDDWRRLLPGGSIAGVSDDAVLDALRTARRERPGIRGVAAMPGPSAWVQWDLATTGWTRNCADAATVRRAG